jgi:endonuclease/exonuclease/phosphatase family metal-dependent hydrolase
VSLVIASWNVLHRVHAVNWDEPVIRAWVDEQARVREIASWISTWDADVVCLQEVSGDQLAALRARLAGDVHATRYPRVPRWRGDPDSTLVDPTEYLVTLVRSGASRLVAAEAFPTDEGTGFQHVVLATGVAVVNTHVTYGDKRPAQLARLSALASGSAVTVICGDFNAPVSVCARELGPVVSAARVATPSLPSRPRPDPSAKSEDIDHVFVGGATATAVVLDGAGRSDHNPVRAVIR